MGTEQNLYLNTAPPGPCQGVTSGVAALVMAHPGHELRVHGWLESVRPAVFVLTDGSGRSGRSRLDSTTRILERAGAQPRGVYGRFTDAEAYSRILSHDCAFFTDLAEEIAEDFARDQVECVAGDAIEGYNPAHDVCRHVINAAVAIAQRKRGRRIANFDFTLVGPPDKCAESQRAAAMRLRLDDAALERKLAAARAYSEIAGEVQTALGQMGAEAFRVECLRPVEPGVTNGGWTGERPFYESYGEQQVAADHYQQVIRYHKHVAPLMEALALYAARFDQ